MISSRHIHKYNNFSTFKDENHELTLHVDVAYYATGAPAHPCYHEQEPEIALDSHIHSYPGTKAPCHLLRVRVRVAVVVKSRGFDVRLCLRSCYV